MRTNFRNRWIRYLSWVTGLYGLYALIRGVALIQVHSGRIELYELRTVLYTPVAIIGLAVCIKGIGYAVCGFALEKKAGWARTLNLYLLTADFFAPFLMLLAYYQVAGLEDVCYTELPTWAYVLHEVFRYVYVIWALVLLNTAEIERVYKKYESDVKGRVNIILENIRTWGEDPKFRKSWMSSGLIHFIIIFYPLLFIYFGGCDEYRIPAGGGSPMPKRSIKIKKIVKKKKRLVNPHSSILFHPPPLEKVDLQLEQKTEHRYSAVAGPGGKGKGGRGKGDIPGFGKGLAGGKIRFIRLKYSGREWDHNMGVNSDGNMLLEFYNRTEIKVHSATEYKTIYDLYRFKKNRKPPFVYMTGMGGFNISSREKKILRRYLMEEHGMIFADNAGGNFHNEFLRLMHEIIPEVFYAPIPIDDEIYRCYYIIPGGAPPVQSHTGSNRAAMGWKRNGRWIVYYHMGDIADAWKAGHSGFSDSVVERAYQTGVNVIYYAVIHYLDAIKPDK